MEAQNRVSEMQIREFGEFGGARLAKLVSLYPKKHSTSILYSGVNPSIEVSTTFTGELEAGGQPSSRVQYPVSVRELQEADTGFIAPLQCWNRRRCRTSSKERRVPREVGDSIPCVIAQRNPSCNTP